MNINNQNPIRKARLAKGWTQQQLADAINCCRPEVARWETGVMPRWKTLKAIAQALNVPLETLIE